MDFILYFVIILLYSFIDFSTETKLFECIEYFPFLYNSFAATSKQIDTSLPLTKPDFLIAETI